MRLCLATALIDLGVAAFLSPTLDAITLVENALAIVAGTLVLAGLWTPLAGSLAALEETAQAVSLYSLPQEAALIHAFLAILSISVTMLGPGAWSIDARLFGRTRFDLDRPRGRRP